MRIHLEGLGFEIAECNSLVKIGMIDALERPDGLRSCGVVAETVWDGTEILSMHQQP